MPRGPITLYSSNYMRCTFINHTLRASSASASGSAWLALYNSISDNQGNIYYVEVIGQNYARVKVTGSWAISTAGSAWNSSGIMFNTALDDWGSIDYIGIHNGSAAGVNSGSILFWGPPLWKKFINKGDAYYIAPGETYLKFFNDDPQNYYTGYSNYSASRLMNHWLNNNTWAGPGTNVYCGLYTIMPDTNGTGGTEVSGSAAYARIKVGGSGSWVVPSTGSTSNIYPIVYNTHLDFSEDWGILAGFCLWDGPGTSNLLFRGIISPRVAVLGPDGFMFDAGDLRVFADIGYAEYNWEVMR